MKRPNPLSPALMSPMERRAEICALLALGFVRLHQRLCDEASRKSGESSLHYPGDQSGHATPTTEETA